MDISSVNSDLIRGNVTTIILGCLWDTDKYGYEILKEIEDKSNSHYVLKQATLYNQLKRLEKQGLVSSYEGDPDDTGGGKRRYYALTKEGRAFLAKERGEYEYSRTILDKLVSNDEYDFTNPIPFDASELRPYSKSAEEKPKVVYKDKIVEKKVFFDRYGNEIGEQDAEQLRLQAEQEDAQLRQTEEQLKLYEEQLRQSEDDIRRKDELLKQSEETAARSAEKLRQSEEESLKKDEQLRQTEEQLRRSEEDRQFVKGMLRKMEEEKLRAEEERRLAEEREKEHLAQEEKLRQEEANRKRQMQAKPAMTIEEMFAKLDQESEYNRQKAETQVFYAPENAQPVEHTYVNAYSSQPIETAHSQSTLKDIFKQLDEREAQIDAQNKQDEPEQEPVHEYAPATPQNVEPVQPVQPAQPVQNQNTYAREYMPAEIEGANQNYSAPADKGQFVTSAVVNRQEGGFEYEKDDVNYREFFVSLADNKQKEQEEVKPQQADYADSDIKTRLYAKGYKIRPYDRGNTSEYYTFNFIQSNRINRDTFLIILAFFAAEVAIMWASLGTRISYKYFLPILIVGCALCLIPTIVYLTNPTRRKRANFNFKMSLLNRGMMFIELTVVCILIGFFGLGANVNDIDLILQSIVLPMVLLTNLPLSSLIYWLLYRTRKYHTA